MTATRNAAIGIALALLATALSGSALLAASADPDQCAAAHARRAELSSYLPVTGAKPVPDLSFFDGNGDAHSISDFRGRGVVLNFWATWCPPCVKELPSLDTLKRALSDRGVEVIILNEEKLTPGEVETFLKRLGIQNLEVFIDGTNTLMRRTKIVSLPTTLLIDAHGNEVAAVLSDADWAAPDIIDFVGRCIGPANFTK